jgi:hypothetical protein
METLQKNLAYVGLIGIVIMCLAILKYFLSGDDHITGSMFASGFMMMMIPTIFMQVTIPAGEANVPVVAAVIMYIFVFPFTNAVTVICIRAITGDLANNSSFPLVGVLISWEF